jgi:hypothetical protein
LCYRGGYARNHWGWGGPLKSRCREGLRGRSLGPLGFEGAQHRQTLRPSVERICSKACFLSELQ